MATYIITALSSIAFSRLASINRKAPSDELNTSDLSYRMLSYRLFAFFSFLPLFFVSAFRYRIAFDYFYTYVPQYYTINSGHASHCEIGFVLLNKLIYSVFHNVDWLFIITSLFFLGLVFSTIYQRSESIPLSIFLLLGSCMYYTSFGQIRQYIVIAVFLYSLKFIEQNKILLYMLIILVSASIHTLALAYLPVFFLCRNRASRKVYILTTLGFLAATPLLNIAYMFLANKFYSKYIGVVIGTDHTSVTMIALTVFVFVLTVLYYNKIPQSKCSTILVNLQQIALVVSISSIGIPESYRLLALFMYSPILLLPRILRAEENKYLRFLLLCLIIVIFSAAALNYLISNGYMLPYQSIF